MASAAEIRAGAAYVELMIRDKLAQGLANAAVKMRAWAASVNKIGMSAFGGSLPGPVADIMRMAMSPAGAFAGFQAASKQWADGTAELGHMAERLGINIQEMTLLKYAAENSGIEVGALEGSMIKMQRSLVEAAGGTQSQVEALKRMGLTVEDFNRLDPMQQFVKMAEGLENIKDPALQAHAAMAIFGRGASGVFNLLRQGKGGILALFGEAIQMGFVIGPEEAQRAEVLHLKFEAVERAVASVTKAIGAAVSVMQGQLLDKVYSALLGLRNWIKNNQELVATIAKVTGLIVIGGGVLVVFGGALAMVATIFTAVAGAATFLATCIGVVLSPIGLIVAAIGGIAGAGVAMSGTFQPALTWMLNAFVRLKDIAVSALGGIWNALSGGRVDLAWAVLTKGAALAGRWISLKFQEAFAGIRDFGTELFYSVWDGFQKAGNIALGWLDKKWISIKANIINGLIEAVQAIAGGIATVFARMGEMISNAVTSALESLGPRWGGIGADEAETRRADASAAANETIQGAKNILGKYKRTKGDIEGEQKKVDQGTKNANLMIDEKAQDDRMNRQQGRDAKNKDARLAAGAAYEEYVKAWRDAMGVKPGAGRAVSGKGGGLFDLEEAGLKGGSWGTFSARGAEAMGQGGPMAEMKKDVAEIKGAMADLLKLGGEKLAVPLNMMASGFINLKNWLAVR